MEEFELIRGIQSVVKATSSSVVVPIGDDTAVVKPPKGLLLTTVDCLVESVHFDLRYSAAREIGHKALAVNLSDVAAMGGKPLWATVSLGLRAGVRSGFVLDLYRGLSELAGAWGVDIVGGNVSRSPGQLFIDVNVMGSCARKPLLRSGVRPGDYLAVTGFLGSSALGLKALQKWGRRALKLYPELSHAHLTPQPRLAEGEAIASHVGAAIDISDGLASELHHLSAASKVKCVIEAEFIPLHPRASEATTKLGGKAIEYALYGGEDYELLVAVSEGKLRQAQKAIRKVGGNLIVIGRAYRGRGVFLKKSGRSRPLRALGHRHRF